MKVDVRKLAEYLNVDANVLINVINSENAENEHKK